MAIPKKVADQLSAGLKRFKPVLESAKARDVNESDTSMIVTDMLADVFGFDKYNDITREYAIRGTYCDLATKIDGKLQTLIEVKAIGVPLAKMAARNGLTRISMGMSADYEMAVKLGATHVRVGSALFGARPPLTPHA